MPSLKAIWRLGKLDTHFVLGSATVAETKVVAPDAAVKDILLSHDHSVHDVSHGPIQENGRRPYANHLSHGVVCMAEIGADVAALRTWADYNGAHSQVPVDEWNLSPAPLDREAVLALRGHRLQYSGLVEFFAAECEASSVDTVLAQWLPELLPAVKSALCHAFISIGLGVRSGHDAIVHQGLAWAIHAHSPQPPLGTNPANNVAATDVLAMATKHFTGDRRNSDELILDPLLHELADVMHIDVQTPGLDLLRTAATIYAATPHNDFFLLHGLTGAFATYELRHHLSLFDQRRLSRHFARVLVALYINRGCPPVGILPAVGNVLEQLQEARREILARQQPDEHVMKAVAVGQALAEETDTDGALCVAVVRKAIGSDLYFG